jgi:tripartite-type tricarboxylate transporter receptor subunit TctC
VLNESDVRASLDAQGLTVGGGSAADFKQLVDAEARRWGPIITRIGVKLD